MTPSLHHRRRAERLAQLLDEASGGRRQRRRNPLDEELADLVALRHRLVGSASPPEIDPEFRAGLRAMLVATAEREGIGATALPEPADPPPRHAARTPAPLGSRAPRARTAVIAGVAVGAVVFTGMSAASENAMPGDALYGVKRSAERAQLALASSDVGRGALYLGFAQTRLAEARLLGNDLDAVLDDMDRDATLGVRLLTTAAASRQEYAALDVIDEFAGEQRTALELLAAEVSRADSERVARSLELLERIEDRTGALREDLGECAGLPVTRLDWLGAVPHNCVAAPAPASQHRQQRPAQQPADATESEAGSGGATGSWGRVESAAPEAPAEPEEPAAAAQPGEEPEGTTPEEPASATSEEPASATSEEPVGATPEEPAAETPQPAPEQPPTAGEAGQADDDSLLTDFNRLVGDLLGG